LATKKELEMQVEMLMKKMEELGQKNTVLEKALQQSVPTPKKPGLCKLCFKEDCQGHKLCPVCHAPEGKPHGIILLEERETWGARKKDLCPNATEEEKVRHAMKGKITNRLTPPPPKDWEEGDDPFAGI